MSQNNEQTPLENKKDKPIQAVQMNMDNSDEQFQNGTSESANKQVNIPISCLVAKVREKLRLAQIAILQIISGHVRLLR